MKGKLEIGSYWYCHSLIADGLHATDIFAKILACGEHRVYINRTTEYGFQQLPPQSFDIEEFLELYEPLTD